MRSLYLLATSFVVLLAGCPTQSPQPPAKDDGVVWDEQEIKHDDYAISLGHRLSSEAGTDLLEPVTIITHNGTSSASAMVFNQLLSVDGRELNEAEAATIYDIASDTDIGHYLPTEFKLPAGAKHCVVNYRIVFPHSEQAWNREVTIDVQ